MALYEIKEEKERVILVGVSTSKMEQGNGKCRKGSGETDGEH